MDEMESLRHTKWECKYHVVFIPKCRRKTLYGELRQHMGEVFRKLAVQKESRIEEGHLLPDHVHMMIAPAKVRGVAGDWVYQGEEREFTWDVCMGRGRGTSWASICGRDGYYVSTVGRDERVIRDYIRNQEKEDKRLNQMNLWR